MKTVKCPYCDSCLPLAPKGEEIRCRCGATVKMIPSRFAWAIDIAAVIAGMALLPLAIWLTDMSLAKYSYASPRAIVALMTVLLAVIVFTHSNLKGKAVSAVLIVPPTQEKCTHCGATPDLPLVAFGKRQLCPTCKEQYVQQVKEGCD